LPSSFGAIQLGETFSSCLCISNEAQVVINGFTIKAEMQTASSKVVLAEHGGPAYQIASGGTFETIVTHEIKELGQHVLACTVTYQLPLNLHSSLASIENTDNVGLQTFRKFYKFAVNVPVMIMSHALMYYQVINPLSVKTKVHIPRSSTALISPMERLKVFLEVHIQNLTSEPLHFERMQIECTDDWNAANPSILTSDIHEKLFSGSQAVMQPQDIRQYIFILAPKSVSLTPIIFSPGSTIPLGRLNIFWRTSFGEPGRLLTSVLSRRIPLNAPVLQPMPTLPSYVKRAITASFSSRPETPQLSQSRPGTPTSHPPVSPSQSRLSLVGAGTIPQPSTTSHVSDIDVNLVKRESPPTPVLLDKPFGIKFSLILSAPMHPEKNQPRVVRLILQHLHHRRTSQFPHPAAHALSTLLLSGFLTPSPPRPTFRYPVDDQKLLTVSPLHNFSDERERKRQPNHSITLPPPFFSENDESDARRSTGVVFTGSSALFLPSVELSVSETDIHGGVTENVTKIRASQDFELSYFPRQKGYTTIGGLRVLLVADNYTNTGTDSISMSPIVMLKEFDVGEVWVS
jgi:trafficking protein particle complex subunit 13